MAWNIEAILLLIMCGMAIWLGASMERDGNKKVVKKLENELFSAYRELEDLREILYQQHHHSIRQSER